MSRPPTMTEAQQAFVAHAALVKLEAANPELTGNPYFAALRDTAYARMLLLQRAAK